MGKLKPCPFCGGKAILLQSGFVYQVQCGSCGASSRNDDKTTSVAHWNTRTDEKRIKELETELAEIKARVKWAYAAVQDSEPCQT